MLPGPTPSGFLVVISKALAVNFPLPPPISLFKVRTVFIALWITSLKNANRTMANIIEKNKNLVCFKYNSLIKKVIEVIRKIPINDRVEFK
ncbi:hypothetical protein HFA01_28790 [Halobacillus faecis]|uniref:Uncharacterized protein n=1 Tax=Halobacillus faecis TaxID=360184 RepID=A0A511WUM2_9BACI|nr:hypothetical protein HFA01_28790 [Halobacillus faecis]